MYVPIVFRAFVVFSNVFLTFCHLFLIFGLDQTAAGGAAVVVVGERQFYIVFTLPLERKPVLALENTTTPKNNLDVFMRFTKVLLVLYSRFLIGFLTSKHLPKPS